MRYRTQLTQRRGLLVRTRRRRRYHTRKLERNCSWSTTRTFFSQPYTPRSRPPYPQRSSPRSAFRFLRHLHLFHTANLFPQSAHENRIYSLRLYCGPQYPDVPPTVQFITQINLPCVNPRNGEVDPSKLPCLAQWKRDFTMETVLIELRRYMASPMCRKLPQPEEGRTYGP